ncbi:hypothetical protein TsocGM_16895 [Tautonia sociabilis]|uniref:Carotenoid 1,2-hydratase n=1 Tax=Tautonia sociabilis TaxID=2080755 RepID=A0A432MGU2_9BACT|nr:hypothetical protein TsocGM_16895 [Tautonia sociabilis]
MSASPMPLALDPDRFFNLKTPGSQEWWYFDALSDDGQQALAATFYVGLPFDPEYGKAAKRHLRRPDRHSAPFPLDHCGLSFRWYRTDGASVPRRGRGNPGRRSQAYSLNSHRRDAFDHSASPFRISIAESRLERDQQGYRLVINAPDWDPRRRISAELRFRPAIGTEPFEIDLGGDGSAHHWILAASDCQVEGTIAIDGPWGGAAEFRGRGYHDHNAGAEALSSVMTRWEWGRVHHDDRTEIYSIAEPTRGPTQTLWLSCQNGKPVRICHQPARSMAQPWKNWFFMPYHGALTLTDDVDGQRLQRWNDHHLDSGPFYQRWLAEFRGPGFRSNRLGISELLDTRRLTHPLFNWMIPYRLRRPGATRPPG